MNVQTVSSFFPKNVRLPLCPPQAGIFFFGVWHGGTNYIESSLHPFISPHVDWCFPSWHQVTSRRHENDCSGRSPDEMISLIQWIMNELTLKLVDWWPGDLVSMMSRHHHVPTFAAATVFQDDRESMKRKEGKGTAALQFQLCRLFACRSDYLLSQCHNFALLGFFVIRKP